MAMEASLNPYLNPYAVAGQEISSTNEGRHVNILEGDLVHPAHTNGFVNKGDPVSFGIGWAGLGVGIALKTASADTDVIPIDTEGIWRLSVVAVNPVVIGQALFITANGIVTDDPTNAWAVIGYSLQTISEAGTEVIAVKVHWMGVPWIWFWWEWWNS